MHQPAGAEKKLVENQFDFVRYPCPPTKAVFSSRGVVPIHRANLKQSSTKIPLNVKTEHVKKGEKGWQKGIATKRELLSIVQKCVFAPNVGAQTAIGELN